MANVFTAFAGNANALAQTLFQSSSGISLVAGSVVYQGANNASSTFDSLSLGGAVISGPGILLTSGDGTPPLFNSSGSYTEGNGEPGDADLTSIVQTAFPGAGETQDATVLSFKVNVAAGIKTIVFDVVFGSDEYSEWSDSSFVDIAAILVNGQNAAFFSGDKKKPLSILDKNLGYFQDNESNGAIAFEYDGISNKLTVIAKVHEGVNDIKIAIADTGDTAYDSGIFIANIRGSTSDVSGILNEIAGTTGNDILKAIKGIDNLLIGDLGLDKLQANTGTDFLQGDDDPESGTGTTGKSDLDAVAASENFKDKFVFKKVDFLNKKIEKTDVILDFDEKDVIDFSAMVGPELEFIGRDGFSGNGGEVRYKQFKKSDFTAVYVDTNGDGKTDASLKLLGLHKLKDGDFDL
ncbi:MAG TPA: choice-of-anchor L domain-containing protein [Bauldia sp.]|nr:choice-of-anchor L domain-containing protein [Bauldia sp.]